MIFAILAILALVAACFVAVCAWRREDNLPPDSRISDDPRGPWGDA